MQIRTTLRFHLTPVKMAIIEAITTTSAGEDVLNRGLYTLLVGMQISTTIMEKSMEIPEKAKDKTTI
jgi:hypothetical protein